MWRYWDGGGWTDDTDQRVGERPTRPPLRTLPLVAALGGLGVTAATLVASRFALVPLASLDLPVVVYLVIAALVGYGPLVWYARFASRTWGTGSMAADLGLSFRWVDLGWGAMTWFTAWLAQVAAVIVVTLAGVPTTTNTEGIDELTDERGLVVALLLLSVLAAPFVEELMFRGVVLRGFASAMAPAWAIVLQGAFFGLAHVDPFRGIGNLGLAAVLTVVGTVFGLSAYLLCRLGPSMVAHAIFNAVVMVVVLVVT